MSSTKRANKSVKRFKRSKSSCSSSGDEGPSGANANLNAELYNQIVEALYGDLPKKWEDLTKGHLIYVKNKQGRNKFKPSQVIAYLKTKLQPSPSDEFLQELAGLCPKLDRDDENVRRKLNEKMVEFLGVLKQKAVSSLVPGHSRSGTAEGARNPRELLRQLEGLVQALAESAQSASDLAKNMRDNQRFFQSAKDQAKNMTERQ